MAYLYRHIRMDTNVPFYVGVGNDTRQYRRAYNTTLRNRFWKNVFAKTEIEVEIIIDGLTYEEILKKEIEFIKLYGRINLGYGTLVNLTDGGEGTVGCKFSNEARRKMSERITGDKHYMYGKKHSPDTIKKMRKIKTGKKASASSIALLIQRNTGRKKSERCRMILKEACSKPVGMYDVRGVFIKEYKSLREASIDNKIHINEVHHCCNKNNRIANNCMFRYKIKTGLPIKIDKYIPCNTQNRPVIQFDKKGNFINEFKSINIASKITGGSNSCIMLVCKGIRKTHHKCIWKYKDIYNG